MKDINSLFWQKTGKWSGEAEQMENGILCDAKINKERFDEFYMKYVQPNAAGFKENYQENHYMLNAAGYDECTLDFIPIADKEYVMLDKENLCFCGTFRAVPYEEDDKVSKSILSLLIADEWDIRKAMPVVLEKQWNHVYFLLNQEMEKFASFLKLKDFPATLPPNVTFFTTTEEMRQYFLDNHGAYLPRKIVAPEPGKYDALFKEIHNTRIQNGLPSDNVFLSICIPTYNRGELALRMVRTALSTDFDAEIEVFVSDNGSDIGKEAYEQIANIQDSRLRYYREKGNRGLQFNIINCLKRAKGHFVLYFADEDLLIAENIGTAMDWLIQRAPHMGSCLFSHSEDNIFIFQKEKVFDAASADAALRCSGGRYITGVCLNLNHIKALDLLANIERYNGNYFFEVDPHCLVMILLSSRFNVIESPIKLWKYGEPPESFRAGRYERVCSVGNVNGMVGYAVPENRIRFNQDAIKVAAEFLSGDDFLQYFLGCIKLCFSLCSIGYVELSDRFDAMYRWTDIWVSYYQSYLQTLREMEDKFEDITSVISQMDKVFLDWLICKRQQRLHTPEENLLSSLQAQIVRYYCLDKGIPIEDINSDQIEKELEIWVQNFLSKGK